MDWNPTGVRTTQGNPLLPPERLEKQRRLLEDCGKRLFEKYFYENSRYVFTVGYLEFRKVAAEAPAVSSENDVPTYTLEPLTKRQLKLLEGKDLARKKKNLERIDIAIARFEKNMLREIHGDISSGIKGLECLPPPVIQYHSRRSTFSRPT